MRRFPLPSLVVLLLSGIFFSCHKDHSSSGTSNTLNQFSLSWNSVHPSYYSTSWAAGNLRWTLYSSPDSTTQHPLNLFSSLDSQLLRGQNLGNLTLTGFAFETAQGLDYAGFFNYTCNPTLLKTQRLPASITYSKTF